MKIYPHSGRIAIYNLGLMNIMTQTFGCLVDHVPEGFGAPLVESSRSPAPSKVVLEDNIHCEKRT